MSSVTEYPSVFDWEDGDGDGYGGGYEYGWFLEVIGD